MPNMTVKCVECEKRDTPKDFMVNVGTEKTKKWCHPHCVDSYNVKAEKKRKKNEEWDDLYQTVMKIHGFEVLHKQMITILQELNNGSYISRRHGAQKKGVPYPLIKEAYMMSLRDIEYFKATRKFDSDIGEFKYCLEIMLGNINNAYKKRKQKKVEEARIEAHARNVIEEVERQAPVYKRKQYEDDISDLLD